MCKTVEAINRLDRMSVKTGYHYTDGVTTYVALANGVPSGFEDATYFAEV